MDGSSSLALSGLLLFAGGLVGLALTCYASLVLSAFVLTEVAACLFVTVLGTRLLASSASRTEDDSVLESEEAFSQDSGRYSPFYYELEPVLQKRALPPVPRDIGRDYDPIVTDKV